MIWHEYFSKLLDEELRHRQARNPAFSLRQFSKKLKISSGALSEIIAGKRFISFEKALQIAKSAELSPTSVSKITKLHESAEIEKNIVRISASAETSSLRPRHYQFLCAVEALPNPTTLEEIAKLLGTSFASVAPVAEQLAAMEILRLQGNKVVWNRTHVLDHSSLPVEAIKTYFEESVSPSVARLTDGDKNSLISLTTFTGNLSELENAQKQIEALSAKVPAAMKAVAPNQVFELVVYLRPVSAPTQP